MLGNVKVDREAWCQPYRHAWQCKGRSLFLVWKGWDPL